MSDMTDWVRDLLKNSRMYRALATSKKKKLREKLKQDPDKIIRK